MLIQRERPRAPSIDPLRPRGAMHRSELRRNRAAGPLLQVRRDMPAPAPLPSLRDALQRRAAVFGPFDGDEVQHAPRGPARALGTLVRRVVAALDLRRAL